MLLSPLRAETVPTALCRSPWDCQIPPPTFLWLCPATRSLQLCEVTFFSCCVNTTSPSLWRFQACNTGHAGWSMPPLCNLFGTRSCHCTAGHPRWPRRILNLTSGSFTCQKKMLTIDYETPCVVLIACIDQLMTPRPSHVMLWHIFILADWLVTQSFLGLETESQLLILNWIQVS